MDLNRVTVSIEYEVFAEIRVSKCLTIVRRRKKNSKFVHNFEICKFMILFNFSTCLPIFTHFMSMFRDFLATVLRKVFNGKIVMVQK